MAPPTKKSKSFPDCRNSKWTDAIGNRTLHLSLDFDGYFTAEIETVVENEGEVCKKFAGGIYLSDIEKEEIIAFLSDSEVS